MNAVMHKTLKFIFAVGLATGLATSTQASVTAKTVAAKNRYLVIYKSQQGHMAMESFMQNESGHAYGLKNSLKYINGMVIQTPNQKVIEQLRSHPEVALIEAEFFTPSPKPVNGYKISTVPEEVPPTEIPVVAPVVTPASPVFQAGEKTPWGIVTVKAPEAWTLSDSGANARVLVLDTGIDKDHPALKANFEKGQNFFESDTGPNPGDFLDKEGHGTHCAGTIAAAYDTTTGFTGVAPKAKILMGRVCGDLGCSNIAVAQGINWGIQQKVDVISMSLGGPATSSAERMAVLNAEKAGVVVVAASGNDGTGKVSYPAALPTPVAVGAIGSDIKKTSFSQWGPELDIVAPGAAVLSSIPRGSGRDSVAHIITDAGKIRVNSSAFGGTKEITVPKLGQLVAAGLGKPEDFTKVDVKGKFALIGRGEIRFSEKVANAMKAQATGVVIYNNAAGLMQGSLTEDGSELDIAVVMIEQTEGLKLMDLLGKGQSASAELATVRSDYALFDGTSMATPHVAGVVALIKSANKKLTPAQVRTILSTTAMKLGPNDQNEYGAGLIQADKAVQAAVQ
jgi:serine protease